MTEQQIIERIRAMTDVREVVEPLRPCDLMRDKLQAIRAGEEQVPEEWINSLPLLFPDDFAAGMNRLKSELSPYDELLEQLGRIQRALEDQKRKLQGASYPTPPARRTA